MIGKVRNSLANLFVRRPDATPPDAATAEATVTPEGAVAPPEDFKFPWTRESADAQPFASVDEALPAAKLVEPPRRTSIEIEIHQDRIDAAANALEVAGGEPFAPAPDFFDLSGATDEFESVRPQSDEPTEELDEERTKKASWFQRLRALLPRRAEPATAPPVAAAATVVEGNPVFLYSKFRAFYNEIIRFKHQKSEFIAGFSTAIMDSTASQGGPDAAAEGLSKKLLELLELQAAEAKWMGGEMGKRYPEAQYAMAALADETFTHLEWEGQTSWPNHLLEVQLYRSRSAEIELFRRIDKLLKDAPNSPVARDLARVYLLVLAAGFTGKYRPFGLPRALAEYRQRLYEFIYRDDALLLYAPERRLFPDAASRTLAGQAVSRFTAAQRWAAILAVVIVSYSVVAHVTWSRVSADLKDVTTRIIASDSSGTR